VRVVADRPRELAAGLIRLAAVDSVELDTEGGVVVLSRDVGSLQTGLPRLASELSVRLTRVEPLDDSLESVFEYLVDR
jgi:hypothetical protein